MRTHTLAVWVRLPLWWNIYWLFNSDITNFVWKTDEGDTESIVMLIFVLWQCFNRWWVMGCGMGQESYLGPAEITSFSCQDFSQNSKHDTFWLFLSTGYLFVLFLWAIAISDFQHLEIYKNLSLPSGSS